MAKKLQFQFTKILRTLQQYNQDIAPIISLTEFYEVVKKTCFRLRLEAGATRKHLDFMVAVNHSWKVFPRDLERLM